MSMRVRDIHDHEPEPLEFTPSADTANQIRPWLPDDQMRCRGTYLHAGTGKMVVCPLRESCRRHLAPVQPGHVRVSVNYLCTDTVSLYIPVETAHARAIRETEDALKEALP